MVTQGCLTVTSQLRLAGSVTVPTGITPIAGTAQSRRAVVMFGLSSIDTKELPLNVVGDDLVIDLKGTRAGDLVCWTAYSS
jgi:hypothetical protein